MVDHGQDFDDWHDEEPTSPLLPPEDRIWRHPSELANVLEELPEEQVAAARRRWLASTPSRAGAGAAGIVGALLAAGVVLVGTHLTAWLATPQVPHEAGSGSPTGQVLKAATASVTSTTLPMVGSGAMGSEIARADAALVQVEVFKSVGKAITLVDGVLISPSGYVVAPATALAGATSISVLRSDGEQLIATETGVDPATGIAVLHVDGSHLPSLPLSHTPIEPDALLLVAWRTTNFNASLAPVDSPVRTTSLGTGPDLLVEVPPSAEVASTPVGTLLLDASGEVSGLVVSHDRHGAVAAPGWVIGRITSYLISAGRVHHGWLGIEGGEARLPARFTVTAPSGHLALDPLTDDSAPETAVRVLDVVPRSAAAAAGLRRGDLIETIDGERVANMGQLQALLYLMAPETTVKLGVIRDNHLSEMSARLHEAA